ncbi:MAG: hypothetical protein ABSG49_10905 [Methanoregula sp.]
MSGSSECRRSADASLLLIEVLTNLFDHEFEKVVRTSSHGGAGSFLLPY